MSGHGFPAPDLLENNTNRIAKGYGQITRKGRLGVWLEAHIEKNGKRYNTTFRSEEKAKAWRQNKEIELFGKFRRAVV